MKLTTGRAIILMCIFCIVPLMGQKENFKPKDGYVPNQETAKRIAEAVWIPIYGEKEIQSEKPFSAILKNGIWTISGHLPEGYDGGVAVIDISKDDGKIFRVSHGK